MSETLQRRTLPGEGDRVLAWPRVGFYHMGQRRLEPQPKTPWWGSEALTTVFAVEALTRYVSRTDVTRER